MAGLKQIKSNIGAMKKSQTVTRAMEAVSAEIDVTKTILKPPGSRGAGFSVSQ